MTASPWALDLYTTQGITEFMLIHTLRNTQLKNNKKHLSPQKLCSDALYTLFLQIHKKFDISLSGLVRKSEWCTHLYGLNPQAVHTLKNQNRRKVFQVKSYLKNKFKNPFGRVQESRQKLQEHHLEPRAWMAALSKEVACRQSNCNLLQQWNDWRVSAHPAGYTLYSYSTGINCYRL